MSALNLRLPDSIHRHIKEVAKKEGVSINQFISTAVSEKNFRDHDRRLSERAGRTSQKQYLQKTIGQGA